MSYFTLAEAQICKIRAPVCPLHGCYEKQPSPTHLINPRNSIHVRDFWVTGGEIRNDRRWFLRLKCLYLPVCASQRPRRDSTPSCSDSTNSWLEQVRTKYGEWTFQISRSLTLQGEGSLQSLNCFNNVLNNYFDLVNWCWDIPGKIH